MDVKEHPVHLRKGKKSGRDRRRKEAATRLSSAAYSDLVHRVAEKVQVMCVAWAQESTDDVPRELPFIYSQNANLAGRWEVQVRRVRRPNGTIEEVTEDTWVPAKPTTRKDNWLHLAFDVGVVLNHVFDGIKSGSY